MVASIFHRPFRVSIARAFRSSADDSTISVDDPLHVDEYMRLNYVINFSACPVDAASTQRPVLAVANGYHLVRWSDGGTAFWATSDLSVPELEQFVALFTGNVK